MVEDNHPNLTLRIQGMLENMRTPCQVYNIAATVFVVTLWRRSILFPVAVIGIISLFNSVAKKHL
jgi:hypothetical protein